MSEPTTTIAPHVALACRIAAGDPRPADAAPVEVRGACREMKSRIGNRGLSGHEWYRLVWRDRSWRYVARRGLPRLDPGNYRTHRCEEWGHVYAGELLALHDRGEPIRRVQLVVGPDELLDCEFAIRGSVLSVTLPDGQRLELPNPRK